MPRKYHRPPTAKRRKSKKTLPYTFEPPPEPEGNGGTELAASAEELDEEDWTREAAAQAEESGRKPATKHLVKDYSYVQGEVIRILALATFLVVSLLITALLRN